MSPDAGNRPERQVWFNAVTDQSRFPDALFRRSGPRRVVPSRGQVVSDHIRPVLLGYIRADMLGHGTELSRMEAELQAFADIEEFSLGTIYVEQEGTSGAFHALMSELSQDETAWAIVVPDMRHLTVLEQLVLTRHEDGARTAVFATRNPSRAVREGRGRPAR